MAKKTKKIRIEIGSSDAPRWINVELDSCGEKGYFIGDLEAAGIYFHIEVIEVKEIPQSKGVIVEAVNTIYQQVVDDYSNRNDGLAPSLAKIGKKKYFIHIDAFAQ
jgi:hypothetical protein